MAAFRKDLPSSHSALKDTFNNCSASLYQTQLVTKVCWFFLYKVARCCFPWVMPIEITSTHSFPSYHDESLPSLYRSVGAASGSQVDLTDASIVISRALDWRTALCCKEHIIHAAQPSCQECTHLPWSYATSFIPGAPTKLSFSSPTDFLQLPRFPFLLVLFASYGKPFQTVFQ